MRTFNSLSEAAFTLTMLVDEVDGLKGTCGLNKEDALRMMQAIHLRIEQEIKKLKDKVPELNPDLCNKQCHCSSYSDLFSDEKIRQQFLDENSKIDFAKKISCAKESAKWLCSSTLFKELKSEAQVIPNGL